MYLSGQASTAQLDERNYSVDFRANSEQLAVERDKRNKEFNDIARQKKLALLDAKKINKKK